MKKVVLHSKAFIFSANFDLLPQGFDGKAAKSLSYIY